MTAPAAINKREILQELLSMIQRGIDVPNGIVAFVLEEDWTDWPPRLPALVAIDCLVAASATAFLIGRLQRPKGPLRRAASPRS